MPWVSTLSTLSSRRGKGWQPWAVAFAIFLVGLVLRLALDPVLDGIKFLTFYPSIAAATLICGPIQGLAVLVLSTLAAWYFFFEPINSFGITDKTIPPLIGFELVGGFIILLVAALRETIRRLEIAKKAQETLFGELQHRVANNLQLVVALLRQA
jgi:K+-sensing histidine kinase KdpD